MRRPIRMVVPLATLAGLALLAGCSAGSPGSADKASGARAAAPEATGGARDGRKAGAQPPVDARKQPKSTFALDVDTASYTYARAQLRQGRLPSAGNIRPEEFVNAFRQDYPEPSGSGFTVTTDGARLPGGDGTRLLRVGLQTRGESPANRRDAALTFVIDTSGSMSDTGKLDLVQDALHQLIGQLRPTDRVAIVACADDARVVRSMTPVSDAAALGEAVDSLSADGGTNLGAGITTGYRVARDGFRVGATNRVVLLSDGLANQGDTDADSILRTVSDEAGKGISLLGVGVGNDYGDAMMERLADHGNGMVVYVSDRAEARKVFVEDLPANLEVRARDAKAQVTFDPDAVASYRLIGFDDRRLGADDFRDDSVDGGWIGPGHSVTALYEVHLTAHASGRVGEAVVRWHDPDSGKAAERKRTVTVADLDPDLATAAPRLRADHAIAYFAELLRGSRYAHGVTYKSLRREAGAVAKRLEDSDLTELAKLIKVAAELAPAE